MYAKWCLCNLFRKLEVLLANMSALQSTKDLLEVELVVTRLVTLMPVTML